MKTRYQVRKWLNKLGFESTAFIYGYAEEFNPRNNGPYLAVDAELSISDCSRKVSLDFSHSISFNKGLPDKADMARTKNVIFKAETLKDEVTRYCDFIIQSATDMLDEAQVIAGETKGKST